MYSRSSTIERLRILVLYMQIAYINFSHWHLERAYAEALSAFEPDAVFLLGDLSQTGVHHSDSQFTEIAALFNDMFPPPPPRHTRRALNRTLFVLPGNHDLGYNAKSVITCHYSFNTSSSY